MREGRRKRGRENESHQRRNNGFLESIQVDTMHMESRLTRMVTGHLAMSSELSLCPHDQSARPLPEGYSGTGSQQSVLVLVDFKNTIFFPFA